MLDKVRTVQPKVCDPELCHEARLLSDVETLLPVTTAVKEGPGSYTCFSLFQEQLSCQPHSHCLRDLWVPNAGLSVSFQLPVPRSGYINDENVY